MSIAHTILHCFDTLVRPTKSNGINLFISLSSHHLQYRSMPQDAESSFEGLGSLIRASGTNIPARARFIAETLVGATMSSLTFGLVCGQVGAMVTTVGPLVPFLWGSCFGYSTGLFVHWKNCKRTAKSYAEKYPSLMMYALQQEWDVVVPESVNPSTLSHWIFAGGLGRTTMSILAAQSCRETVEEIQQKGRDKVAEQYHDTADDDDE